MPNSMPKTEDEWKKKLTPEQFRILREKGTELPFTGKYTNFDKQGNYVCAGCGNKLFSSVTKFESHCGWPAFFAAISKNIEVKEDRSFGMSRTEVICKKCKGHLGHLFDDGPEEKGGKRYCINSAALDFEKEKRRFRPRFAKRAEGD